MKMKTETIRISTPALTAPGGRGSIDLDESAMLKWSRDYQERSAPTH
jgi:hypothetical protein